MEEARTKLLLSLPPRGRNVPVELAKRLELWDLGDFHTLLLRAEAQQHARVVDRRRTRGGGASARSLEGSRAGA